MESSTEKRNKTAQTVKQATAIESVFLTCYDTTYKVKEELLVVVLILEQIEIKELHQQYCHCVICIPPPAPICEKKTIFKKILFPNPKLF